MRALISYHFLVNVENEAEAKRLASEGAQINVEMMARELEMLGINPEEARDELRSCGATVAVLD